MFSKKVYIGTVVILSLGSVLNIIGRFSPWIISVKGPKVYNEDKTRVINGTINFGWFFLEVCDPDRCYIQSMSHRYDDHNTMGGTQTKFAETWLARRRGEQTIEAFAFIFNVVGAACCGLVLKYWATPLKQIFGALSATFLLMSSSLEWGNLGEVMGELGSLIRSNDKTTEVKAPASFIMSLLGAVCLLFVSGVYYLGVFHTLYIHTDDEIKRFFITIKTDNSNSKTENGVVESASSQDNDNSVKSTDQTSV